MEPPEFVGRLAADPVVARRGSFALFVLTYLAAIGLAPGDGPYAERVRVASALNPYLFTPLGDLDAVAAEDLVRWSAAQHLEREDPQVAYELGLLALGVELPPIMVRSLRELELTPTTRVTELPDGAGYPTVFLSTLHPHWPAGDNCTLLVTSADARLLAAWALLLLTRRLEPRAGAIVPVEPTQAIATPIQSDIALLYNTPLNLDPRTLVDAPRIVVV